MPEQRVDAWFASAERLEHLHGRRAAAHREHRAGELASRRAQGFLVLQRARLLELAQAGPELLARDVLDQPKDNQVVDLPPADRPLGPLAGGWPDNRCRTWGKSQRFFLYSPFMSGLRQPSERK